MPVPKRRLSRSRKNMRNAHRAIKPVNLSTCPRCEAPKLPHRVCLTCGYYKKEKVLEIEEV